MNFLVLGFLVGERTLRDIVPVVLPLIELIWGMQTDSVRPRKEPPSP